MTPSVKNDIVSIIQSNGGIVIVPHEGVEDGYKFDDELHVYKDELVYALALYSSFVKNEIRNDFDEVSK